MWAESGGAALKFHVGTVGKNFFFIKFDLRMKLPAGIYQILAVIFSICTVYTFPGGSPFSKKWFSIRDRFRDYPRRSEILHKQKNERDL